MSTVSVVGTGRAGWRLDGVKPTSMAVILGTPGADNVTGTSGNDDYHTGPGNDAVHGGAGDDGIIGWTGNDILYGEGGDDFLQGFLGSDILYGGDGDDTLDASDELPVGFDWTGFYNRIAQTAEFPANWNVGTELPVDHSTASYIYGGAGNDTLIAEHTAGSFGTGGEGTTYMYGGTGNDIYYARFSDQNYIFENAGEGVDLIYLMYRETPGSGTVFYIAPNVENLIGILGSSGHVTIVGNGLDNNITTDGKISPSPTRGATVMASAGADNVTGTDFGDQLYGEEGNDRLVGSLGLDWLIGAEGADELDATSTTRESDVLIGGIGNDLYIVDSGGDLIFEDAGEGVDRVIAVLDGGGIYLFDNVEDLSLQGSGAFGVGNALDNQMGTASSVGALLLGGGGNDQINGNAQNDIFYGEAGDDNLGGGGGSDYLFGGEGRDFVDGQEGSDVVYGEGGNDVLWGGRDTALDYLWGGEGNDELHSESFYTYGGAAPADADVLIGGAGNDIYYVDSAGDLIFEDAGGGTDIVIASTVAGGGVYLFANVENLSLIAQTHFGVGNDLANNISGNSLVNWLLGGGGDDSVNGWDGDDVLFGEAGRDTLTGWNGNDWLYGGDDNDQLWGGAGDDICYGDAGNDELRDDLGSDYLLGGEGNDQLYIDPSNGDDYFFGCAGADQFIYAGGTTGNGVNHVMDFEKGVDKLRFLGFTSVGEVRALMTQVGTDTVFTLAGGSTIVVYNTTAATLTDADLGW